jgi:DNA-binding LacI/PurR family transcriptional regulator
MLKKKSRSHLKGAPATIKDVAAHAGVSVATVSRVISELNNVRPELRDRVQASVRSLGYRPNRMARNFRKQRTQFIGLIIADIENPFYTAMVRAVEDASYSKGYRLLLCNSDEHPAKEREYIEFMRDEYVAGVIASPTVESETSYQPLLDIGIPVVAIDRRALLTPVDTVMLDHEASAHDLTQHLIDYGHTRIGAIITDTAATSGKERMRGFLRALNENNIEADPELIQEIKPDEDAGFTATMGLLTMPNRPTALFCGNNVLTVGALKAIRQQKLNIPSDLSLVGHDELPWMSLLAPAITVSAQPIYEMGIRATELLMSRIEGERRPFKEIRMKSTLIVRQSCASPRVNTRESSTPIASSVAPLTRHLH